MPKNQMHKLSEYVRTGSVDNQGYVMFKTGDDSWTSKNIGLEKLFAAVDEMRETWYGTCEGCGYIFNSEDEMYEDSEGVPLCKKCLDELIKEQTVDKNE